MRKEILRTAIIITLLIGLASFASATVVQKHTFRTVLTIGTVDVVHNGEEACLTIEEAEQLHLFYKENFHGGVHEAELGNIETIYNKVLDCVGDVTNAGRAISQDRRNQNANRNKNKNQCSYSKQCMTNDYNLITKTDCSTERVYCQNGCNADTNECNATSECNNECTASEEACSGSTYKKCGQFDDDVCLDWKEETCQNGCNETNGKCNQEQQQDQCQAGVKCKTNNLVGFQRTNCSWEGVQECPYGCENGNCNSPTDSGGQWTCYFENARFKYTNGSWGEIEQCEFGCTDGECDDACEPGWICVDGGAEGQRAYENWTIHPTTGENVCAWTAYEICANGCEKGQCEPETNNSSQTCTDSDGRNYYTKGYVSGVNEYGLTVDNNHDSCLAHYLGGGVGGPGVYELYCENGTTQGESVPCAYGCENGACNTEPECSQDSDCNETYCPQVVGEDIPRCSESGACYCGSGVCDYDNNCEEGEGCTCSDCFEEQSCVIEKPDLGVMDIIIQVPNMDYEPTAISCNQVFDAIPHVANFGVTGVALANVNYSVSINGIIKANGPCRSSSVIQEQNEVRACDTINDEGFTYCCPSGANNFTVSVEMDYYNKIDETNENNNIYTKTLECMPDRLTCECGNWSVAADACGTGECNQSQIYQTRTCEGNCSGEPTSRCADEPICS